jgi:interleukin-1 receptor-associated kinase 1
MHGAVSFQVADFGLARWHAECNISSEGRVNRTSGYLSNLLSSHVHCC